MKRFKYSITYLTAVLFIVILALGCENSDSSPAAGSGTGTAGSFASFIISGDYLYAINGRAIKTFELGQNGEMTQTGQLPLDATLETIFPYGDLLLVGSQEGVFFIDKSAPADPQFVSVYRHITACDPVVAKGTIAFSTLRSTRCRFGNVDQLDVIDFSDIQDPFVLTSYNSVEPLGLGIRGEFLFLCEDGGLSMYQASDPSNLEKMDNITFDGAIALDVIPADQYLVVTTNRGIYNVSFTDLGEMRVLGQVTAD